MGFLASLEESSLALWVAESLWGYPFMLSLHVIGLSMAVGVFAMRDLALLGAIGGLSVGGLKSLLPVGWVGLAINASSGAALFSSQATFFVTNTPFLIKIGTILLATICAAAIGKALKTADPLVPEGEANRPTSLSVLPLVSLCLWTGAIVAGRLIAYL
ncbi:MAG: hypothetical protein AAF417_07070 [Pseudomonadota bacterium]